MSDYKYVSQETIEANKVKKTGCPTCQPYKVKGYVHNAGTWVRCYQCNPTPKPTTTATRTYNALVEKGMKPTEAFALAYPEAAKARAERVAKRMKDSEHAEQVRRQIRLEQGCAR